MAIIRRGAIITVQFRGHRARLAVVVRSSLWRQSDNSIWVPLTEPGECFKVVRTYVRVPDRAGIGMVDLVAEIDRMQWVPRG